ncbi:DUF362 domain-containing protein [Candidatus Poribacteria bacterium]|nr:DUF362 domain-containing protein [Candidatus Poribacteria bacterium]
MIKLTDIVQKNPDAVFIRRTNARDLEEPEGFREGGYLIAKDLFAKAEGAEERLILKPNVTVSPPKDSQGRIAQGVGGIVTSPHFIGGLIDRLQELSAKNLVIAEGGGVNMKTAYDEWGYTEMAEKRSISLFSLTKHRYESDELNWMTVDGVVMKDIPFVRPIGDGGTRFINIPTLKTHNLGITTLCCKNLQGIIAVGYKHFCSSLEGVENAPEEIRAHFQPDLKKVIVENYKRHVAEGWPFWDKGAERDEIWAQRISDALLGVKPWLNIVEGIIGRDGTAFNQGKDALCNLVVAGVHPVHVDAITTYLMGHNPERVNYLMIAQERGLGKINPHEIDVYVFGDDGVTKCTDLDSIGRCPLGVYHYGDSSKYMFF